MKFHMNRSRYAPGKVRLVAILLAAGGLASGLADTPPETMDIPEEQESVSPELRNIPESIIELLQVLNEYGLHFDPEAIRRQTLKSLVRTADPHGRFMTDDEIEALEEQHRGWAPDPGIRVRATTNGFKITDICEDGPAAETSLKPGDMITHIDYAETKHMGLHRFLQFTRDDTDAPLRLTILDDDGSVRDINLTPRPSVLRSIETAEELPVHLSYLRINALLEESGAEVVEQIRAWKQAERYGLVLDLRGASGHNLDAVAQIASLFAEPGSMLFAFRDKDDQEEVVYSADSPVRVGMPTMVLVDSKTTGAAEILAAVLKHSARGAMLFGQPTNGDLLVRDVRTLSSGEHIYIATRKLVLSDGSIYDGRQGIQPDVHVPDDPRDRVPDAPRRDRHTSELPETIEHDRLRDRVRDDAALRRSVDVLLGLKALNVQPFGSSTHNSD